MKKFKFYKETDNRWYIDLPEWQGSKEELEMVAGADSMLEYMAEGKQEVLLMLSEVYFPFSDKVEFVRPATEVGNGAFYKLESYKGFKISVDIWLCDVVKFVFGDFPEKIFISKINE